MDKPSKRQKTLSLSKLKAFAYDKFNIAQMVQYSFDMEENIVEKAVNIGFYHHFSFSHTVSKGFLPQGHQKSSLCGKGLTLSHTTNLDF